jgi:hypothetical protein
MLRQFLLGLSPILLACLYLAAISTPRPARFVHRPLRSSVDGYPLWEARFRPYLLTWQVTGWYAGPEYAEPECVVDGRCWTYRQAREHVALWVEDAAANPSAWMDEPA